MQIATVSLLSGWELLEPWQWEALLRMAICVAIGIVIGFERELHGRPAGVRTHSLVCLGCCVIMLVSINFARMYAHLDDDSVIRIDPARLAYGVVTGIGFLGAGVIMKDGVSVHGLTTATSLWGVAALGLSAGVGMYVITAFGTAMMFVSLLIMRHLSQLIQSHHYRHLTVTHKNTDEVVELRKLLEARGAKILKMTLDHRCTEGTLVARYDLRFVGERTALDIHKLLTGSGPYDRIVIS